MAPQSKRQRQSRSAQKLATDASRRVRALQDLLNWSTGGELWPSRATLDQLYKKICVAFFTKRVMDNNWPHDENNVCF
jgi:hypothetical protein